VKRLVPIAPGVLGAETSFRVAAGIRLPLRMTVLCTAGGIALVAPIPIDDALAAELAGVGPVQLLIAPNLLHHASLEAASERYPGARVLAAPGLAGKRPGLRIDATLTSSDVTPEIQALHLQGVDALSEVVLLHRPSRTLVVTDLVFNVHEATGLCRLVLSLASRAFGRVEQSRLLLAFHRRAQFGCHFFKLLLEMFEGRRVHVPSLAVNIKTGESVAWPTHIDQPHSLQSALARGEQSITLPRRSNSNAQHSCSIFFSCSRPR
jgi:hypothetical protein